MRVLSSRVFLWTCLFLFIAQTALVDARSKKEKKKIEEEPAPDPVTDEENSDPPESGRDARQQSNQSEESQGVISEGEADSDDAAERTKKSYCATDREHDGHYKGHGHPQGPGHHGPYGRSDGHYQPDMDRFHGGGHGPGYGPGQPHGFMPHGSDQTNDHHQGNVHFGGHDGYGGDSGKGHANPGYARKSQGDGYGYGGQGGKGPSDQYHAAASAPSSVYRPSYQAGREPYGGGGGLDNFGYGGVGPSYNAAPNAGANVYSAPHDNYAPHPGGQQAPAYSAGRMKPVFGGGVYAYPAAYGLAGPAYGAAGSAYGPAGGAYGAGGSPNGAASMYGPLYHGPSGYPPVGAYSSHAGYNPYMPYNPVSPPYQYGASYPMSAYPMSYGYGPSPAYQSPSVYQMHGPQPGIPVTLTCSLQQHDAPYGFPPHPRGHSPFYRASDSEPQPSKPPITMVMVPANHTKPLKPNEKPLGKEQKDEPTSDINKMGKESSPAMGNQAKPEGMQGEMHPAMGGGSGEVGPHTPRESASYQRLPFSLIRQRQMESMMGPKRVFYEPKY